MLIDEVRITIKGGDGGDGIVHFYNDAFRPKGGPDGGIGGDGGSVYFEAVSDISKLNQFRHTKVYGAENGEKGGKNNRTGKNGEDLIIQVPVGTLVTYDNGTSVELTEIGQKVLMAKGGTGGRGNYCFKSSTNQTPQERELGYKCPIKKLFLQLKLIAQIGLIGLPNAGKTSLLNELTPANAKVANYAFTTLEPNLGVTKWGSIIADIPGLIEGAAEGKGLGVKFLKHIERTSLLVHCIAADSSNPLKDYQTVRQELSNYSSNLANKPEIIVITKSDTVDPKEITKLQKSLKAQVCTSIIDSDSIKKLSDLIAKKLKSEI
jgi:GTP-binding protein